MDSDIHIAFAETDEERRAVYRFRYEIYVEEMGKYRSVADHAQRLFHEPVDEQSRIVYATQNGEVVATARSTWGGDGPFPQRMIDQYDLAPFLAELPQRTIGGLGLHFVRRAMDDMTYRRSGRRNHLRMTKRIDQGRARRG